MDEMGNGGDFVAFIRYVFLGQSEAALCSPGAYDMAGFGIESLSQNPRFSASFLDAVHLIK